MQQVREIILFGWTENFSTRGPEQCSIESCKTIAGCTNNKHIFLTIIQWHVRLAHLQFYEHWRATSLKAKGTCTISWQYILILDL